MFDSDDIRIRCEITDHLFTSLNDLHISNNGSHVTFKSTNEQGAVSISLCELWASNQDFYYEARMTGSNNSIAVGLIPYEIHKLII